MKTVFEIDGRDFGTLEEFFSEISRVLLAGAEWGQNLDAFDDILQGGFGTPDEGFILVWRNSDVSRVKLGYPETVRQLLQRLLRCHQANRPLVAAELERAKAHQGPTVFDWLVEIIESHYPGGTHQEDGVELVLK